MPTFTIILLVLLPLSLILRRYVKDEKQKDRINWVIYALFIYVEISVNDPLGYRLIDCIIVYFILIKPFNPWYPFPRKKP